MSDIPMLGLVALLGAVSAVVAGLLLRGAHSLRDSHVAKRRAKEARTMARETEPAQGVNARVVVEQAFGSTPVTGVANAGLPEITKSYVSQPVLVSPKPQISAPTQTA